MNIDIYVEDYRAAETAWDRIRILRLLMIDRTINDTDVYWLLTILEIALDPNPAYRNRSICAALKHIGLKVEVSDATIC